MYFTGSYYDGLRVDKPNEFDLNLVCDLRMPKDRFKVSYIYQLDTNKIGLCFQLVRDNPKCAPGYVQLQIDNPTKVVPNTSKIYPLRDRYMKSFLDQKGEDKYLFMPTKYRQWIIGIMDKAWHKVEEDCKKFGLKKVLHFHIS